MILRIMVLSFVAAAAACKDPCVKLAEKICRCEPTDAIQRACVARVGSESGIRKASDSEARACRAILDGGTCSCDALADGNLEGCGLSQAAGT